jgi:hypothetical protein
MKIFSTNRRPPTSTPFYHSRRQGCFLKNRPRRGRRYGSNSKKPGMGKKSALDTAPFTSGLQGKGGDDRLSKKTVKKSYFIGGRGG